MMFRYSFNYEKEANIIDLAIKNVLNKNIRTADIAKPKEKIVSTTKMGNYIVEEIADLLLKS